MAKKDRQLISSCKCLLVRPTQSARWSRVGSAWCNIMEFCKAFNAETQGTGTRSADSVVITVYSDSLSPSLRRRHPRPSC